MPSARATCCSSRAGTTVEIGNTDAEGRLVLADALALADEEAPHSMFVFATLTGAARVALGPDLPAMFTDDDAFAAEMVATSASIGDPVWRLPLWPGYDGKLDSPVADMNNVWEAPFAGSITAALFLQALRQERAALCPFRPVRLASAGQRARPARRRAADGARRVRRSRQGALPMSDTDEAPKTRSARAARRAPQRVPARSGGGKPVRQGERAALRRKGIRRR